MNDNCEYVSNYYQVPACIGRRVSYNGRRGIITKDKGAYIGVTFDDEPASSVNCFHPLTEGLEYMDIGTPRQMTRSQLRYQRYLEMEDCFENFKDFLKYDMRHPE